MLSTSQVEARLAEERREREHEISKQSFFCLRRNRFTTPGDCHDCFASLPYLERLIRWSESRMRCMEVNSSRADINKITELAGGNEKKGNTSYKPIQESVEPVSVRGLKEVGEYSIEQYLVEALLEFLMEFDSLSERFETWWLNLADAARTRVPGSPELGEMVIWFAERLEEFRKTLVLLGRLPENNSKTLDTRRKNVG